MANRSFIFPLDPGKTIIEENLLVHGLENNFLRPDLVAGGDL